MDSPCLEVFNERLHAALRAQSCLTEWCSPTGWARCSPRSLPPSVTLPFPAVSACEGRCPSLVPQFPHSRGEGAPSARSARGRCARRLPPSPRRPQATPPRLLIGHRRQRRHFQTAAAAAAIYPRAEAPPLPAPVTVSIPIPGVHPHSRCPSPWRNTPGARNPLRGDGAGPAPRPQRAAPPAWPLLAAGRSRDPAASPREGLRVGPECLQRFSCGRRVPSAS